MDVKLVGFAKRQHAFEAWLGRNRLKEDYFAWRVKFSGNEMPGWWLGRVTRRELVPTPAAVALNELAAPAAPHGVSLVESVWERQHGSEPLRYRIERLKLAPGAEMRVAAGEREPPAAIESAWKPQDGRRYVLLSVNLFECASRPDAHEFTIRILAQFQSRMVERRDDIDIGDIAFAGPRDSLVLFVRGNLVALLRNGDRDVVPLYGPAKQLDEALIARPDVRAAVAEARRRKPPAKTVPVGASVPLSIKGYDEAAQPVWHKIYSSGGEVMREGAGLVYRAQFRGLNDVTQFTVGLEDGAVAKEFRFNAE